MMLHVRGILDAAVYDNEVEEQDEQDETLGGFVVDEEKC